MCIHIHRYVTRCDLTKARGEKMASPTANSESLRIESPHIGEQLLKHKEDTFVSSFHCLICLSLTGRPVSSMVGSLLVGLKNISRLILIIAS